MPGELNKIGMRAVASLVALLLIATPVTQVLAQATHQEREPHATETTKPDLMREAMIFSPMTDSVAALLNVPALDRDAVSLVRPEATSIFPISDPLTAYDTSAATPPAAAISTGATIAIVVVVVVVVALILVVASLGIAASGNGVGT